MRKREVASIEAIVVADDRVSRGFSVGGRGEQIAPLAALPDLGRVLPRIRPDLRMSPALEQRHAACAPSVAAPRIPSVSPTDLHRV